MCNVCRLMYKSNSWPDRKFVYLGVMISVSLCFIFPELSNFLPINREPGGVPTIISDFFTTCCSFRRRMYGYVDIEIVENC